MQPYKILDTVMADTSFEAYGKNLNELFQNAALATTSVMIESKTLKARTKKTFTISASTIEELLFSFLEHLIFLKDAEQLLFKTITVTIHEKSLTLTAELTGDTINTEKQTLGTDVKAVTYHTFKIEKTKIGWKAHVVLDV